MNSRVSQKSFNPNKINMSFLSVRMPSTLENKIFVFPTLGSLIKLTRNRFILNFFIVGIKANFRNDWKSWPLVRIEKHWFLASVVRYQRISKCRAHSQISRTPVAPLSSVTFQARVFFSSPLIESLQNNQVHYLTLCDNNKHSFSRCNIRWKVSGCDLAHSIRSSFGGHARLPYSC